MQKYNDKAVHAHEVREYLLDMMNRNCKLTENRYLFVSNVSDVLGIICRKFIQSKPYIQADKICIYLQEKV